MTRLVFVTQVVDPADPVLGFVVPQLRVLAASVDRLAVVANEVRDVPADLGFDLISLGKDKGRGQVGRGLRYVSEVNRLARRLRPQALVAHMCPIYLSLAAPVARAHGVRTLLWFVHPANSRTLRTAERLSDSVMTALPGSYPRRSAKVRVIGHAVDTERFGYERVQRHGGRLRLLTVGRTSPVKGYELLLRAVGIARQRGALVELRIVGPSTTPAEHAHRKELQALIRDLGLDGLARVEEGRPPWEVPNLLHEADVVVSATAAGSADKVVFEAMACGRPVLVTSPAFKELVAGTGMCLDFPQEPEALAGRICAVSAAADEELSSVGSRLRSRIESGHSLTHWADSVVALSEELHGRSAQRLPGKGHVAS